MGRRLNEKLKHLTNDERLNLLGQLPQLLEVELPVKPPPMFEPMTWEDVRRLSSGSVEFGAHTCSHPILSSILDNEGLLHEIDGSRRRINEKLQHSPIHFAYPNGRMHDRDDRAVSLLSKCGFASAVLAEGGFNRAQADCFALARVGVDPVLPMMHFIELLAGLRRF